MCSDPVTLHKYLYGNVNPIMFTDPTGNFGLAEVSVVNNIVGVLANMQVDNGFNLLDSFGVDTSSARNANLLLGIASMGGKAAFSMMRMLSSKFRRACNSFDGSTLVSTEFGLRKIQNIKIGEYVWAYDEKTGEKSLQEVVHLIRGEGLKDLVDIQLASGDVITATAGHPLYTPEKPEDQKWTNAGQLTIDDVLQGITQSDVRITNLYEHKELATVYNLTVANDHTYYVGVDGVLGHNITSCDPKLLDNIFDHMFLGTLKARRYLSGFHHAEAGLPPAGIIVQRLGSGRMGFYEAKIYRKGKNGGMRKKATGGGSSTMFPDEWTQKKVKSVSTAAYIKFITTGENPIPLTSLGFGSKYRGISINIDLGGKTPSIHPIIH